MKEGYILILKEMSQEHLTNVKISSIITVNKFFSFFFVI